VGSFPIKIREAAQVDRDSSVSRSLQQPDECDVRQIGIGVAAADIGMAAAEPDFVDLCVRAGRFVPIRRLKAFSFFVECQRVGDAQHIARVDAMKVADGSTEG